MVISTNIRFFIKFCSTSLIFFYNKFIETDLRLVNEQCVTSFPGNVQGNIIIYDIEKCFHYFFIVYHYNNYTHP